MAVTFLADLHLDVVWSEGPTVIRTRNSLLCLRRCFSSSASYRNSGITWHSETDPVTPGVTWHSEIDPVTPGVTCHLEIVYVTPTATCHPEQVPLACVRKGCQKHVRMGVNVFSHAVCARVGLVETACIFWVW